MLYLMSSTLSFSPDLFDHILPLFSSSGLSRSMMYFGTLFCMLLLVSCSVFIAQLGASEGPWVLVLHWSTLSIVVQVWHICCELFVVSVWTFLEGIIVVHCHNPGGLYRGIVLLLHMLVWWCISILLLYVWCFTSLSISSLLCLCWSWAGCLVFLQGTLHWRTSVLYCCQLLMVVWVFSKVGLWSQKLVIPLCWCLVLISLCPSRTLSLLGCAQASSAYCFAGPRSEAGKNLLREWSSVNLLTVLSAGTILSINP